jgi:hypothetical protein
MKHDTRTDPRLCICFHLSGKASFRPDPKSIKLVLNGFQGEGNISVFRPSYQFHAARCCMYTFDFHTLGRVSKHAKLLPKRIERKK